MYISYDFFSRNITILDNVDYSSMSPPVLLNAPPSHEQANPGSPAYPFNQESIINKINPQQHKSLLKFIIRFDGLCELICNYVIIENLLGKKSFTDYNRNSYNATYNNGAIQLNNKNHLKDNIHLSKIDQPKIKNSHILNVSTFFQKVKAYLFNIFPFDIFSGKKIQDKLNVSAAVLSEGLAKLENNTYIKFSVFKKNWFSFRGHSMLIKKTTDQPVLYSFFDPNVGETTHLTIKDLCGKINAAMQEYQGTHMAFINGNHYINNLKPDDSVHPHDNTVIARLNK